MLSLAKALLLIGIVLLVLGAGVYFLARLGISPDRLPFGRLPGDIRIQRENFTCLFPLASTIILSLVLTVVLNVILRLLNK